MLPTDYLDLGHSGPTSSNSAHTRRCATTPRRQAREHQASEERDEAEPEESSHRLCFLTSFRVIV